MSEDLGHKLENVKIDTLGRAKKVIITKDDTTIVDGAGDKKDIESRCNIKTIGELVKKTEAEMLKYRNFGKKSLNEITAIVKEMGLNFGMDVDLDKLSPQSLGKVE